MSLIPKPKSSTLKQLDDDFNIRLPFRDLDISVDSKEHRKLMRSVREFYFRDVSINEETISYLYDYLSDVNFVVGADRSVKQHAKHAKGKAYYVWISIDSTLNAFKSVGFSKGKEMVKLPGAAHSDDLCYLFRCSMGQEMYDKVLSNEDDEHSKISLRTIDHLTTLFTNFAKYGEPSHQNNPIEGFQPVDENDINFLHVSNEGLKTDLQPRKEAMNFWKDIEEQAMKAIAIDEL